MIVIQTKREGNFINLASLLMAPYIAFVFINNFFFYKRGFYKISDAVLLMILSAFVCFFISGLMIFPGEFPKIYECRIQFFSKPNPEKQQAQSDETGKSLSLLQGDLISEQKA